MTNLIRMYISWEFPSYLDGSWGQNNTAFEISIILKNPCNVVTLSGKVLMRKCSAQCFESRETTCGNLADN